MTAIGPQGILSARVPPRARRVPASRSRRGCPKAAHAPIPGAFSAPIAVTAASCSTPLALRLKDLDVRRLVLRPFKVKGVLDAISALRPAPAESHKAA